MNARSRRLHSLSRIAHHRRHQAGQALAEARKERDRLDATLGLLRMHFQQYRQQLQRMPAHCSMQQLREFQHFIHRLQQAIELQERALEEAEQRYQHRHAVFLQAHGHYKALDLAGENLRQQARKQAEKQAQKILDELSIQRHRH